MNKTLKKVIRIHSLKRNIIWLPAYLFYASLLLLLFCGSIYADVSCPWGDYENNNSYSDCGLSLCSGMSFYSKANDIKWGYLESSTDSHPYVLTSEGYKISYACRGDGQYTSFYYDGDKQNDDIGTYTVTNSPTNRVIVKPWKCNTYTYYSSTNYCDIWWSTDSDWSPSYSGSKYIHVIRCYNDSDCGAGYTCDKSAGLGNSTQWACQVIPSISGNISANGVGLSGVLMVGLPGNPQTDAEGNYNADVSYGWSGTVTPEKAGYTFTPSTNTYTNISTHLTQNYEATGLPEINVLQNGTDIPSSNGTFDYGVVNESLSLTFTIENIGTGDLILTGSPMISVTGEHASDFAITQQPSDTISANDSTTFEVTFTPGDLGARNAIISIENNDSDETNYRFEIHGNNPINVIRTHDDIGVAGDYFDVCIRIDCEGSFDAMGIQEIIPSEWEFVTVEGDDAPVIIPDAGTVNTLEFTWLSVPNSPIEFCYRLSIPSGTKGDVNFFGQTLYRLHREEERQTIVMPSVDTFYVINEYTDTDNDGLTDINENQNCTDSNDADTDDDGISDGNEDINLNGVVDYGETDPCDPDTDDDGIYDGTEVGLTAPETGDTDIEAGFFIADTDPTSTTDPLNNDSDGDGTNDGVEDINQNGAVDDGESDPDANELQIADCDFTSWHITGYSGDPEWINKNLAEDGNWDTAASVSSLNKDLYVNHPYNGVGVRYWKFKYSCGTGGQNITFECYNYDTQSWVTIHDAPCDPDNVLPRIVTRLIPNGCLKIGEDIQLRVHSCTSNQYFEGYVLCAPDEDEDGIPDNIEKISCTLFDDDDTDNDGIMDGNEDKNHNGIIDDGETNPCDPDTDEDTIFDGTENGLITPESKHTDISAGFFIADTDPATTTDPLSADTDNDGIIDGNEDQNINGLVDSSETDPNDPDSDNDKIYDGTEIGLTAPQTSDTDESAGNFIADADPSTTTDPINEDSDGDGLSDGEEDLNGNGMVDFGEADPNNQCTPDLNLDHDIDGQDLLSFIGSKNFNCLDVFASNFGLSSQSENTLINGLVAYYTFNGNTNDESRNGNNGFPNGGTFIEDRIGNPNSAFYFDGIDDFITVPHNDSLNISDQTISLSFWFKYQGDFSEYAFFLNKSEGNDIIYSMALAPDSIWFTGEDGNDNWSVISDPILANTWTHVVGVRNGSSVSLYINGQLEKNTTTTLGTNWNNSDLIFGMHAQGVLFYKGSFDDARIYSRALSDAEVRLLYNQSE